MPGRKWTASNYRYSHNGHEKEEEIFSGAQSAEFWMYDSRIGRRWELDPIQREYESPYACFSNNPIYFSDLLGLAPGGGDKGKNKSSGKGGSDLKKDNEWKVKQPQNNNPKSVPIDETKSTIYLPRIETKLPQDNTMVKEPDGIIKDNASSMNTNEPSLPRYTDSDVWFISVNPNLLAASNLNTQNYPLIWNSREPNLLATINFPYNGLSSVGVGYKNFGVSLSLEDGSLGASINRKIHKNIEGSISSSGPGVNVKGFDIGLAGYGTTVDNFKYIVEFSSVNKNKLITLPPFEFRAAYKIVNIQNVYDQVNLLGREIMHIKQYRNEVYPNGLLTGWFLTKDTVIETQTIGGSYGPVSGSFKFDR
ncbi:MAG: hypothetical protein IM592_17045 [Bacteroidetes bacterium]|nr:hypothetical protein [Bacteroidota bacterium]